MCTGNILESEGRDRSDLNLPGNQLQLLQDAADSATSECDQRFTDHENQFELRVFHSTVTVLVLYNAGPLDVSWAVNSKEVIAILESFFPSQVNLA